MSKFAGQLDIFDELERMETPHAGYRHRYERGRLIPGEDRCPGCGQLHQQRVDASHSHSIPVDGVVCVGMDLTRRHVLIDCHDITAGGRYHQTVDGPQKWADLESVHRSLADSVQRALQYWPQSAIDTWLADPDPASALDRRYTKDSP